MRSLVKVTAVGSRACQDQGEGDVAWVKFQFHEMKASWKEKWLQLDSM